MRDLEPDFIAQLTAVVKAPVMFFEGDFASGTTNIWSGIGDIDWDGKTWVGFGTIAQITQISETSDVKAEGILITLSGINDELRALILQEVQQGKAGVIYIGFMDDSGGVIADPANAFDGRLDVPSIKDTGQGIAITLAYENRLRDLEKPRERRYTNQDQQRTSPGDFGFEYVPSLQDWAGTWGRA